MINADKPLNWKNDVQASVQMYNEWFLSAAPKAYRDTRAEAVKSVEAAFTASRDLTLVTPDLLKENPRILQVFRMCTSPPLARDRLSGLANIPKSLVSSFEEKGRIPPRMPATQLDEHLGNICAVLVQLRDADLFSWVAGKANADARQRELAAVVVADRLVGSIADPIIRNAQERRQLALIGQWLDARGYVMKSHPPTLQLDQMEPGTYSFRQVVVVGDELPVNIPVDVVVQPRRPARHRLPILIEAKSAGDFTNTNKRRKEEATKMTQLRSKYGFDIGLLLFLCGYFDSTYLGYEAAEGMDWVWEHRIDDLQAAGL